MKSLHLLYHELRPGGSRYSYVTPCAEFEAHCELFARRQALASESLLRPDITFDDGHLSDHTYALPLLDRYGLQATFFITAGWTGKRAGYMDWPTLRELRAAGHTVGAHGMEHRLLTGCSAAELHEELNGARSRLEDGLGETITAMSLPGGRSNAAVLRACFAAGFTQVFTSVPRAEGDLRAPGTVGRLNLVAGTTVPWLERLLAPDSGVLQRLERADRVKGAAKAILGDHLYAKAWSLINRQEADDAEAQPS